MTTPAPAGTGAVVPTPAPAPTNGAPKGAATTPTPPAGAPPAPVETKPPAPDADRAKWQDDMAKRERLHALERRKFSEAKKAFEQARVAEKARMDRLEALEKKLSSARANPDPLARELWGEKYTEALLELKANGAPPAQLIASETERLEAKFRQELEQRDRQAQEAAKTQSEQREAMAKRQLQAEVQEYMGGPGKEHGGLLAALEGEGAAHGMLAQRIETEYHRSAKRDPDSGELLVPGRLLSPKEAAEQVEAEIYALVDRVTATEAYRARQSKAQGVKAPPAPPNGAPVLERRTTLSNDLTGTTRPPPERLSPEEKRARTIAAFEAARRRDKPA